MAKVTGLPVIDEEKALVKIIKSDGSIKDREQRMLYISLAGVFEEEFSENLDLTSLELNDKYGTGSPSTWQRFLNYPSVKKYIKGFLDERAEKAAAIQLSKSEIKTSDAIKVTQMMDNKKTGEDNSRLVVVFLPQKDYLDDM